MTPKAQERKKMDKLDNIKILKVCASKDTINSEKVAHGWEIQIMSLIRN